MRFKEIRRSTPGTYTRDGSTVPVTRTETVRVPAFPVDFNVIALRVALGIVLTLTTVSIAWSTWSIGNLLQGGVGYAAATIFDFGWATALLLEYLARYDETKRPFPEKLGWGLLVVTMSAIAWDGWIRHSIPMAVIGAFVSAFAKLLWIGVMKHVNAQLTPDDKQWLTHQISGAQAQAAVAQVRRAAARIEQRAALELLAMEHEKSQVSAAFNLPETNVAELETNVAKVSELVFEPPTLADLNKTDAVRLIRRQHPDAKVDDICLTLEKYRDDIDPKTVRKILSRIEPGEDNIIEFHE